MYLLLRFQPPERLTFPQFVTILITIMTTRLRFAVAIHILALLAAADGQPLTSEQIAGSVRTNPVVIRRLLGCLRQSGLVESRPGACGGWRLQRPPTRIRLDEVYRSVDGEPVLSIHTNPNPNCPIGGSLTPIIHTVFQQAQSSLESALAQTTIAAILNELPPISGEKAHV